MTGRELRTKRVAAGIKTYELAIAMGVHATRVSQIEALAHVTEQTQARYLSALGQCLVSKSQARLDAIA